MAMRYTEKDIPNIPLTEFMAALDEKPVKIFDGAKLYYAPQRDDSEPMLLVDEDTNRWYDYATDERGDIIDLASLKMNPSLYDDPKTFILKYMNEYEQSKPQTVMNHLPAEQIMTEQEIHKVRLTDFMKALGQEQPVASAGDLRIYNAPYDSNPSPTMVINTDTNLWRDFKTGKHGCIYDLATALTGSYYQSELIYYISEKMATYKNQRRPKAQELGKQKTTQDVLRTKPKPGRKMRF